MITQYFVNLTDSIKLLTQSHLQIVIFYLGTAKEKNNGIILTDMVI